MMEHFLYLGVDFFSFLFPFVLSFHPKWKFLEQRKHLVWSTCMVAVPFLFWDAWFTGMGVWGFNDRYLSGIYLGRLPLEELLFFLCIPFASLFTYSCIGLLTWIPKSDDLLLSSFLALGLFMGGIFWWDRWYTSTTFCALSLFLLAHVLYFRFAWMRQFYLSYLVILPFFFLTNGILTGYFTVQPVVWYNDRENLGLRLGSIPLEDIFYGMLLLLMNTFLFEEKICSLRTKATEKVAS